VIEVSAAGLYCAAGGFHIDPWAPVERAVITHAHPSHARQGSQHYLTASPGESLLRARLGSDAQIQSAAYGERIAMDGVTLSLHPAGHILGSAQVRIERAGEVWVVSGDYNPAPDPTCAPFEPLRCDTFITESTFGLPIYRWAPESGTAEAINAWWRANRDAGLASVLFASALGTAQRTLAMLDVSLGPVVIHEAAEEYCAVYRAQGISLPERRVALPSERPLAIAPPSVMGSPYVKQFGPVSTAMVSGWMRIRGARRRRSLDRGFALSSHADWPGLLSAIDATGAPTVWVGQGYRVQLSRWLEERGRSVKVIDTPFEEDDE
jgi:putative mRNA 3-end processing factor